ncbi:hypothetical protein COV20_02870 [Candidatus Woesearchaeota archaeon CG10_big_fil_rev_8_21_14_0_10_45_16]|nr:MAG: hypothetical protein COV20_02870 [Candidatus Woesearchaeota archaeon CG10_big_fil_rev_8_21_14_0_10_45_16]
MEKEAKQHLIYGIVIAIVLIATVSYTVFTKNELSQEISQLQSTIQEQITTLEKTNAQQDQSIQNVESSLEQQGTEISSRISEVESQSEQRSAVLEESLQNLKLQNQDFSEVIDKVIPSVVSIQTNTGIGSGFIISKQGYIVTNYHVVDGISSGAIETSNGKRHQFRIVGFDSRADIAVLQINTSGLKVINFGNSNNLRVGEKVIAVGSPGGLDFSVSQGIVSAVGREDSRKREFVQIDVPINPGNSGGPLINAAGEVVGVNTQKITGFEGVGFALASNYVSDVVDDILRDNN